WAQVRWATGLADTLAWLATLTGLSLGRGRSPLIPEKMLVMTSPSRAIEVWTNRSAAARHSTQCHWATPCESHGQDSTAAAVWSGSEILWAGAVGADDLCQEVDRAVDQKLFSHFTCTPLSQREFDESLRSGWESGNAPQPPNSGGL
ncbi:hypothetical protein, partial [Phormidesmis priestleyi]